MQVLKIWGIIFIIVSTIFLSTALKIQDNRVVTEFKDGIFDDAKEKIKDLLNSAKDIKSKLTDGFNKIGGLQGVLSKLGSIIEDIYNAVKDGLICITKQTIKLIQQIPKYNFDQTLPSNTIMAKLLIIMNHYNLDGNWLIRINNLIDLIISTYSICSPFKELATIADVIISFTPLNMIYKKIISGLDEAIKSLKSTSLVEYSTCFDLITFSNEDYNHYSSATYNVLSSRTAIGLAMTIVNSYVDYKLLTLGDKVDDYFGKNIQYLKITKAGANFVDTTSKYLLRGPIFGILIFLFRLVTYSLDNALDYNQLCLIRAEWYKIQDESWKTTLSNTYSVSMETNSKILIIDSNLQALNQKVVGILNHFNISI